MSMPDLGRADPRSLASLLDVGALGSAAWSADELGAVLRHQLDTPIADDLAATGAPWPERLAALARSHGPLPRTFADLLSSPRPPVELLNLVKQYAKASRRQTDALLPAEVATFLYLAAIAAALVRAGQRITEQDDQSLAYGFRWVLDQPWVGEPLRGLFREGQRAVGGGAE